MKKILLILLLCGTAFGQSQVDDVLLPYWKLTSDDPNDTNLYLRLLVSNLQDILDNIRSAVNMGIDLNTVDVLYLSLPGSDGSYTNDTWRLYRVDSDDLEIQKKISGIWTKIAKWSYVDGFSLTGDNFTVSTSGNVTASDLDITGNTINIVGERTISGSSSTGTKGDICWDDGNLYICKATNSWVKVSLGYWAKTPGLFYTVSGDNFFSTSGSHIYITRSYGVYEFNVMDYGAIGDGAAEDSTAIQAAIDAAELVGGILVFPPGTYIIDTTLTIGAPIHIIGYGAIIKQEAGADQGSIISIDLSAQQDITIYGLKVDGNMDNNAAVIGFIIKDITNCYSGINIAAIECDIGVKIMGECEANVMYFSVSYNGIGVLERSTGSSSSDENTFYVTGKYNNTHYRKDTLDEGHNSSIHLSCESAYADAIDIDCTGGRTILSGILRGCDTNGVVITSGYVLFNNLYINGDVDSGWGILCDNGDGIEGDVSINNFDDGGVWIKAANGALPGSLGITTSSNGKDTTGGPALRLGVSGTTRVTGFIVKPGSYLYTNGNVAINFEYSRYCTINSSYTSGVVSNVVFSAESTNDTVVMYNMGYDVTKISMSGTNSKVISGWDIRTFTDTDTTPSVMGSHTFMSNTTAVTIARFDDGYAGDEITIISGGVTTYDTTANARLLGSSADIVTATGDVTKWVCQTGGTTSSVWRLVGFVDVSADNSGGA